MSYNYDDDDLFDYDPENETASNSQNVHVGPEYTDQQNKLITAIKDNFDSSEDEDEALGSVRHLQARLAASFQSASSYFITNTEQQASDFAQRHVLDYLTDGNYSYIELFYLTESKIVSTINFINIAEIIFFSEDSNMQEIVKEIFDVDLSDTYVETCFISHLKISQHSLLVNRMLYTSLSEYLDIPIKEELLLDETVINDITDYSYHNSINHIRSDILKSFTKTKDVEKMKEFFGTDVRIS